jgi:putative oxidoreductase
MKAQLPAHWWTALRWLFGALMLWAAVSKLANPTDFLSSIYAYKTPVPRSLLQVAAVVLPWLELLCGLLLIANVWSETALATMIGLLVIFVLATGQAWARGLDISCGCFNLEVFGADRSSKLLKFIESASFAFCRNLVLVSLAAMLLRRRLTELGGGAATALSPSKS